MTRCSSNPAHLLLLLLLGHLGGLAAHLTGTSQGAVHLTCGEQKTGGKSAAVGGHAALGTSIAVHAVPPLPASCTAAAAHGARARAGRRRRRPAAGQGGARPPRRCCPSATPASAGPGPRLAGPAPPRDGMARGGRPRPCASPMVAQMCAAAGKEAPRGLCKAGGPTWRAPAAVLRDPGAHLGAPPPIDAPARSSEH